MKITAVLGSPSKNGNTCVLAREALEGARDSGADVEEIFLAEHRIEFCRGCISKNAEKTCMSAGLCAIDDDVNALRKKLYDSDGIILASPSYGILPTARMKNFLIDRIGMYTAYVSGLGGKYFLGISTCGGIGAKAVAKNLARHFVVGFHQRGYMSGYLGGKLGYDRIETRPELLEKAYLLGRKLVRDIEMKKTFPCQKFFERMLTVLFPKKIIIKNIRTNKDGRMKSVYENLLSRRLIKP